MTRKNLLLALLSGLLLSLPWSIDAPGLILGIALVPLLMAENDIYNQKLIYSSSVVFILGVTAFFSWNIFSMWWVTNISFWPAMLAITLNSIFYAVIFWIYHSCKRILGERLGVLCLLTFWLSFEFFCLHAEFAQPWLILGNGLANISPLIQWFEFTGVLGGSIWILVLNLIFLKLWNIFRTSKKLSRGTTVLLAIFLILPIIVSLNSYFKPAPDVNPCKIALIQPNIDPYTEKFDTSTREKQLLKILNLAAAVKDTTLDYYVIPETALDNNIWENALLNNYSLFALRSLLDKKEKTTIITGAITYREFHSKEKAPEVARWDSLKKSSYVVYNSALQLDNTLATSIYHKSKLVLGVEKEPFPHLLKFINNQLVNLGGINVSYGEQENRSVLTNTFRPYKVAPVICYESVYGDYVTGYIKNGANLVFVLTNDGWWKHSNGYYQHLKLSRIRAIETRRDIARSANTGISAIINSKGDIIKETKWWATSVLTGTIYPNQKLTFYVQYGDYIGRIALFTAIALIMVSITRFIKLKTTS